MANISAVPTYSAPGDGSTVLLVWTLTSAGSDVALPFAVPAHTDKSIHVSGTFGGGTVTVQGSNNGGASFIGLTDPTQTAISMTSEAIKAILENTALIRPVLTGGSGTTVVVSILCRMASPLRGS
jgi:hypothetical protein